MAYSAVRKVAMVSCLVLCVSLLLPRTFLSRGGRQEPGSAPPTPPEEIFCIPWNFKGGIVTQCSHL